MKLSRELLVPELLCPVGEIQLMKARVHFKTFKIAVSFKAPREYVHTWMYRI